MSRTRRGRRGRRERRPAGRQHGGGARGGRDEPASRRGCLGSGHPGCPRRPAASMPTLPRGDDEVQQEEPAPTVGREAATPTARREARCPWTVFSWNARAPGWRRAHVVLQEVSEQLRPRGETPYPDFVCIQEMAVPAAAAEEQPSPCEGYDWVRNPARPWDSCIAMRCRWQPRRGACGAPPCWSSS